MRCVVSAVTGPDTCPDRDFHGKPFRYCHVKGCGWLEPHPAPQQSSPVGDAIQSLLQALLEQALLVKNAQSGGEVLSPVRVYVMGLPDSVQLAVLVACRYWGAVLVGDGLVVHAKHPLRAWTVTFDAAAVTTKRTVTREVVEYVIGERGPELVDLPPGTTVHPGAEGEPC